MNVGEIRDFVRTQLDVDEEEYPNALLDAYIDEAFTRTVALEPRWPGYEFSWTVTKAEGDVAITPPADLNIAGIDSLINATTGRRLLEIGPEQAEDFLLANVPIVGPAWFTTYGNVINLWPQVTTSEEVYIIRGQRVPLQPGVDTSFELDCDVRLHRLITHYVIALMYAQQEDEVLEEVYMKRWVASYASVRRAIFMPRGSRPFVLNGGLRGYRWGGDPVAVWELP